MPKFLTITETRKQLLRLPEQLTDEPVIITKHGKPAMVALGYEQFESLMETLDALSDPELMSTLRQSIAQADQGQTVALAGCDLSVEIIESYTMDYHIELTELALEMIGAIQSGQPKSGSCRSIGASLLNQNDRWGAVQVQANGSVVLPV